MNARAGVTELTEPVVVPMVCLDAAGQEKDADDRLSEVAQSFINSEPGEESTEAEEKAA